MVTGIILVVVNTTSSNAAQNNFDIGDYTGIGALIATAITFIMTHRHSTQSEQTRIARETWEKISDT
jgi:surface polysaccharide O-acyltransferase-like enzyme